MKKSLSTHSLKLQVPAIQVSQLSVNYESAPALWDISLSIPNGKLVGIIGPNGGGKSTFIKALLNLVVPIAGSVQFSGQPLEKMRKDIAYVPQRHSVDWDFPITAYDLVLMGCYGRLGLCRRPNKEEQAKAYHYLDIVGMSSYQSRQIGELSGGQQQRVFLARALMQEANLYLMDEPFIGIDAATEATIIGVLRNLQSKGKTILVVHHDLNTVSTYFDWIIVLNTRLIAAGEVSHTLTSQVLESAYGKSYALFDRAFKLAQEKSSGKRI